MFTTIWEYEVAEHAREEFEQVYGPDGLWAQLFHQGEGYIETILLRDVAQPTRYVILDRWQSRAAYDDFLALESAAYSALNVHTRSLILSEQHLGVLEP